MGEAHLHPLGYKLTIVLTRVQEKQEKRSKEAKKRATRQIKKPANLIVLSNFLENLIGKDLKAEKRSTNHKNFT